MVRVRLLLGKEAQGTGISSDVKVVQEDRWYNQRPKMIRVSFKKTKESFNRIRQEIEWWKLRIEKQDEYQQHINRASLSREPTWTLLFETMRRAAKAVCDLEDTIRKICQWMRCYEEQAIEFKNGIQNVARKCSAATNDNKREGKGGAKRSTQRIQKETQGMGEPMIENALSEMRGSYAQTGYGGDVQHPETARTQKLCSTQSKTFKQRFQKDQERGEANGLTEKPKHKKSYDSSHELRQEGRQIAEHCSSTPKEGDIME